MSSPKNPHASTKSLDPHCVSFSSSSGPSLPSATLATARGSSRNLRPSPPPAARPQSGTWFPNTRRGVRAKAKGANRVAAAGHGGRLQAKSGSKGNRGRFSSSGERREMSEGEERREGEERANSCAGGSGGVAARGLSRQKRCATKETGLRGPRRCEPGAQKRERGKGRGGDGGDGGRWRMVRERSARADGRGENAGGDGGRGLHGAGLWSGRVIAHTGWID